MRPAALRGVIGRLPWRGLVAAVSFVAGMTALGWGFGLTFLVEHPGPARAALGFAIRGCAGVLFALTAVLLGLTRRD